MNDKKKELISIVNLIALAELEIKEWKVFLARAKKRLAEVKNAGNKTKP